MSSKKIAHDQVLQDYQTAIASREASVLGRKEVLTGKAKFGIFGDGKEVAQVALARSFQKGDWRSGYYRDQTWMMACGVTNVQDFFAQLYADPFNDPASAGRQMNSHFCSRYISESGEWLSQKEQYNTASDISPTAGQMARSVGLAYASKIYRKTKANDSAQSKLFSDGGNEVCFVTIGNASTSEGLFWESLNAAGVLQIPLVMIVWDDGYGISVPNKYQTTKESVSAITKGFHPAKDSDDPLLTKGVHVEKVKGWNYEALLECFSNAAERARTNHEPSLIHVTEMTQPQGHSTSGSHERYKSEERLEYEDTMDPIQKMRGWILSEGIASEDELASVEKSCADHVKQSQQSAWSTYQSAIQEEKNKAIKALEKMHCTQSARQLKSSPSFGRRLIQSALTQGCWELAEAGADNTEAKMHLAEFSRKFASVYGRYALAEQNSPVAIEPVDAEYSEKSPKVDGRQVIQAYFDQLLAKDQRIFILGEDAGKIGGVNSEFEGLQAKHGEHRVTDTGIREATIFGQGLGASMRGLRPIVDIQYLDYLLYCIQGMSDDLSSLHYRSAGAQSAPAIVRTKGHRLEGIWHSGSPIQMILGSIRGMHFCVPRNMVQAVGMYQTLLEGNDPALVIEVLSGYRLKEQLPDNLGTFKVALGVPEVLRAGSDLTLVTYGACCKLAMQASKKLAQHGIEAEVIDVQTLLPFDKFNIIGTSLEKTGALLCLDEDMPGGATGYMLERILVKGNGYQYLDCKPQSLSASAHRPAYGSDGDYYSKPNIEDIELKVFQMMAERKPADFADYSSLGELKLPGLS